MNYGFVVFNFILIYTIDKYERLLDIQCPLKIICMFLNWGWIQLNLIAYSLFNIFEIIEYLVCKIFYPCKLVWVNNKICSRHDKAEILLKLTLNTNQSNLCNLFSWWILLHIYMVYFLLRYNVNGQRV